MSQGDYTFHLWYSPPLHREMVLARGGEGGIFVFPDGRMATHVTRNRICPVRGVPIIYVGTHRGADWTEVPADEREVEDHDPFDPPDL